MNDLDIRQKILDQLEFEPGVDATHIGVAVANGVATLSGHVRSFEEKAAAEKVALGVRGVHAIAEEIEVRYPSDNQAPANRALRANDLDLRQDILDELEFEPSVDAAHIGVAVEKGVATLTGYVGSYAEKVASQKAALRVKGVRAVIQEVEVRYAGDKKTADDEIAGRAVAILRWSAVVPTDSVMVKVEEGMVTLTGQVNWNYQRSAAESEVRRLSGVTGVLNAITLAPKALASDIKHKIEEALKRSAQVEARKIAVSVRDGTVGLDGFVHDWQERAAIERAAWSAPGVQRVEDRLRIA